MDTVDPQTRTIKVQAELDNASGRFRPEMFGTIRLTKEVRQVPVLPKGAVIQGDDRNTVFVEQSKGHFQQVEVKIGKPANDLLPVLSGVSAGDRVVVEGAMLLKGLQ
jgi:cobalt-zinc-cadmium efflux system membrane fusion protein